MISLSEKQKLLEQTSKVETKSSYEGKLISVRSDTFKDEKGKEFRYDIVMHPGAVVMIPIHKDGRIHFVKQWRRAIQDILIELPAGTLEKNEEPLYSAQRELQEEIGYKARRMTNLGGFFTAPGFCNEYLHLFLAEDLIESFLTCDDSEHIDHCILSLQEALDWIEKGRINDAKTICGIYRYLRWIKK